MPWVYILTRDSGRHYIGSTTDLGRRLEEHRRGHSATTRRLGGNLQLVTTKQLPTLQAARILERNLKRMKNPAYAIRYLEERESETAPTRGGWLWCRRRALQQFARRPG